jgi:aminomethyltransferase
VSAAGLKRTPLHDRHVALGARMVPFAGWEMPVQYDGVIPEHLAVRRDRGVFDVSHMGQFHVEGPKQGELLQSLLSNDLARLTDGDAQYTLLTNEQGGIIDDLIAYRLGQFHTLLVVNAGNRQAAYDWLKEREISGTEVRDASDEYALLAVQGPTALASLGLVDGQAFTHSMAVGPCTARSAYSSEASRTSVPEISRSLSQS